MAVTTIATAAPARNSLIESARHSAYGRTYRIAVMAVLSSFLLLAGGASRPDEIQQVAVRLAAIAAIVATLWPLQFGRLRAHRKFVAAVGAIYVLLLAQLIPLPPATWALLPGRAIYADIAEAAGAVTWRPLSLTPDLTINVLFSLLPATAAGLAALYLESRQRLRVMGWIVAGACFSALLGLVQLGADGDALHLFRQSSSDSAVGLFANRNHHAAFLACALTLTGAVAGVRLHRGGGRRTSFVSLAVALLLLLSLLATGSRMALVLGPIGLLGAALCLRASGQFAGRMSARNWAAAAVSISALLAVAALSASRSGIFDRLAQTDAAAESRVAMLSPLVETARAFMPWGSGFGSFDRVYRRFEPDELLSTIYMNQAHNEPLQLAIEGGLPALALLALFLWWWTGSAIGILRFRLSSERKTMAIAAMVVTFMLMASSLVDYPLRTPLLGSVFIFSTVQMMRARAAQRQLRDAGDSCASPGRS